MANPSHGIKPPTRNNRRTTKQQQFQPGFIAERVLGFAHAIASFPTAKESPTPVHYSFNMTIKRVLRKPEQDLWAAHWRISTPFLTGIGLLLMLAYLRLGMAGGSPAFSATEIPWIQDQVRCEKSGRIWDGNACWDTTHDPNF